MNAPLPFSVSPEAGDHIRSVMRAPAAGKELALIMVLRQSEMVDGREQVWFEGEYFMLGVYDIGRRPQAEHIELFGHRVSIMPPTLESLRGRTLMIRRVADCTGVLRDVLVAT